MLTASAMSPETLAWELISIFQAGWAGLIFNRHSAQEKEIRYLNLCRPIHWLSLEMLLKNITI